MANTSAVDLVWHMADFYPSKQHIVAITLALDGRHRHWVGVQRIGRYANAASGFGLGLSLVVVDFLLGAHARLGLAAAFGVGLADLPRSLMA
jgi:hypothetical protein